MTFFYDLNKRMAELAKRQDATQTAEQAKATAPKSQLAEAVSVAEAGYSAKAASAGKDLGKPGKNFAKIAKSAGKAYGSKAAGERVAGAVLNKLRHPTKEGVDKEAFAKLAPPTDKITFADKIAGAKQEVDEMLGDVAAEAMKQAVGKMTDEGNAFTGKLKSTPKGGKFKLGDKEFTDTSDIDEGFAEMDAWLAAREKEKGTGRYDKKKISTGTVYTRKPETFDDPETDPEATGGAPKRRGRPKGKDKGPERVTAKSYKYKSGRPAKTHEDLDTDGVMMTRQSNMSSEGIEPGDRGEYDQEGESAKHDIKTIVRHAQALHKILGDDDNLPEWVQSKLAKIEGMMIAVDEYMQNQDQEVSEKAPPGAKAERMVKHIKKSLSKDGKLSDKDKAIAYATTWKAKKAGKVEEESTDKEDQHAEKAGKKVTKDIEHDEGHKGKDDAKAEKAGKKVAKDIEYDDKKDKEEKVKEGTTGGYDFGGGVYESFNSKVENIITEGMNVSVNMSTGDDGQPTKSINISADGAEADQLAELLKMAGLGNQPAEQETCSTCGESACACDQEIVDENSPDWPTDQVTSDDALQYSGGLNKPKSTGQTTIPVVASQLRRQVSMEENVELERSLFKFTKNLKGNNK
jgi:hypothetical protein